MILCKVILLSMSHSCPVEPFIVSCNSDINFSSSAPSSPQSINNISRRTVARHSVCAPSSAFGRIYPKYRAHKECYSVDNINSDDAVYSIDTPVHALKRSSVLAITPVCNINYLNHGQHVENEEQNIPGAVYICHHHDTDIDAKTIKNHHRNSQLMCTIPVKSCARKHQVEQDSHLYHTENTNHIIKQNYHNNNFTHCEVYEQSKEDSNMLSDNETGAEETNENEHGDSIPLTKENQTAIESLELIDNDEKQSSPILRTLCLPVGNSTEVYKQEGVRSELESEVSCINGVSQFSSIGIQVSPSPQYRLRFLPICGCTGDESEWEFCRLHFVLRLIGRWAFSQCGLGILMITWALLGAAAFHSTEGPQEEEQTRELRKMQEKLVFNLSSELKKIASGTSQEHSIEDEPAWRRTTEKYVAHHEMLLLGAVSSGYGEGGGGGKVWSYAGSVLFAVSLLTTLGFGAPVPRTTLGRIAAVIFAAIGIPLHLLLVLNIGMLMAVKLQNMAGKKVYFNQHNIHPLEGSSARQISTSNDNNIHLQQSFSPPLWLKWFPAAAILTYYIYGVLIFGAGRSRPFSACLLFPLDFTAAGGVGLTSSSIRTCYAIYLEGAVTLAAICVSLLQVVASRGLTDLGLKLGLLTNS